MSERPVRIVVAGGGITGLTAAYRLLTSRPAGEVHVTLLEGSDRLGGSLFTKRASGLVLDGGADAFVTAKPQAIALCKELGLGARLQETRPESRRVYFLKGKRLVSMPEGLVLAIPTRFWPFVTSPLFSKPAVMRMGFDLMIPRKRSDEDESIASFLDRRFGREAVEILGEPLLAGIYSGDPGRLSIESTFPMLTALEREHGGLIMGALAARAKRPAAPSAKGKPPPSPFAALKGGMGELVEALEQAIRSRGGEIRMSTEVAQVERDGAGFSLATRGPHGDERVAADRVLLACTAPAIARALEGLAPAVSRELRAIPHASTASLLFVYARADVPHPLDASGVLIPRREGHDASAITFMSSKWADRAPDDVAMLRVFLGGHARPEVRVMTEDDLVAIGRAELARVMNITAEPRSVEVFRWNDKRPQPVVGHADRLTRIRAGLAAHPGLLVAGAAFDGVGIPDCIKQAETAASSLLAP